MGGAAAARGIDEAVDGQAVQSAAATPAWAKPRAARRTDRIDLQDTPAKAVFKLAEGDRAAAEACIAMVKAVASADPRADFRPFTPLAMLEAIGLVGPAIGAFYSRVCGGDPLTALAVMHAARLKLITPMALKSAVAGRTKIDAPNLSQYTFVARSTEAPTLPPTIARWGPAMDTQLLEFMQKPLSAGIGRPEHPLGEVATSWAVAS